MPGKIGLESGDQRLRPGQFDSVVCFGLGLGEFDPPLGPPADQSVIEVEINEIAQAEWPRRDQRDYQAIATR